MRGQNNCAVGKAFFELRERKRVYHTIRALDPQHQAQGGAPEPFSGRSIDETQQVMDGDAAEMVGPILIGRLHLSRLQFRKLRL